MHAVEKEKEAEGGVTHSPTSHCWNFSTCFSSLCPVQLPTGDEGRSILREPGLDAELQDMFAKSPYTPSCTLENIARLHFLYLIQYACCVDCC